MVSMTEETPGREHDGSLSWPPSSRTGSGKEAVRCGMKKAEDVAIVVAIIAVHRKGCQLSRDEESGICTALRNYKEFTAAVQGA